MLDWPGCCVIVCVVCYSLSISPESPAWVGAWWIGFLVSGVVTICIAFPLLGFPKVMPGGCERFNRLVYMPKDWPSIVNQSGTIENMMRSFVVFNAAPALINNGRFLFQRS